MHRKIPEGLLGILGLMILVGLWVLSANITYAQPPCLTMCNGVCNQRVFECKLDCWIKYHAPDDGEDTRWFDRIKCYYHCNSILPACATHCIHVCAETGDSTTAHPAELELQCYKACRNAGLSMELCIKKCGEPF